MFKFTKMEINNFMSIKKATMNLADRGLVLIEGKNSTNDTFVSNGSGKSSLINAITYSIYGQTSYGLKADDVINRNTGKNMKVIMNFELDGECYRIERYRKHTKEKNKVKLFKGEHNLTGKSNKDTESAILELFGIDYLTYMNSIVQGQGETEIFSKATDKGKKEILENVTNIVIYKKAQDIAKEKLKDAEYSIKEADNRIIEKERDIEFIKHKRDTEKEQYAYTESQIEQTQENIKDLVAQRESLSDPWEERKKLESLQGLVAPDYPSEPKEVEEIRNKYQEYKEVLINKLNEVKEKDTSSIEERINTNTGVLDLYYTKDAEIKSYINSLETGIERDKKSRSQLDTSTTCRVCGQPIDADHIKKEYQALTDKIQDNERIVTQQKNEYNATFIPYLVNLKKYLNEDREAKESLQKKYENEYSIKVTNLDEERDSKIEEIKSESIAEYKKQMEVYNAKIKEKQRIEYLLTNYQQQLDTINTRLEDRNSQLDTLKAVPKPKTYEDDINTLEEKIKELNTTKSALMDNIHNHEDVVKVFSNQGIRSVVLDLVTPYLNERANEYMNVLSGSDIEILFKTQVENKDGSMADKFDLEIINRSGGESYKSNSEGEKRRIDMAISFAIQDLVMSKTELQTNLAVYDECFEGLDEVGCENVITLLKERQKRIGSIFVITHNTHLKALFDKVITVEKKEGISYVYD